MTYKKRYHPKITLLENNPPLKATKDGGKSDLDQCLKELRDEGENAIHFEVSPHKHHTPEHRLRLFILSSNDMTNDELHEVVELLTSWEDKDVLPLESFLYPPGSKSIDAELARALSSAATFAAGRGAKRDVQAKWPESHWGITKDVEDPGNVGWRRPEKSGRCPWFDVLADRQQNILEKFDFDPIGAKMKIWDLSQNMGRTREITLDCAPAVLPGSILWHSLLERPIFQDEKMAIQGIVPTMDVMEALKGKEELKHSLAGNAFCGYLMLRIIMAIVIVRSKRYMRETAKTPTLDLKPRVPVPSADAAPNPVDAELLSSLLGDEGNEPNDLHKIPHELSNFEALIEEAAGVLCKPSRGI